MIKRILNRPKRVNGSGFQHLDSGDVSSTNYGPKGLRLVRHSNVKSRYYRISVP